MDTLDLQIIELLKQNARITSSDISRKINLSIPAVSERIRKLEESGVIEQYTVKLNRSMFDYTVLAFIQVNVAKTQDIQEFREQIQQHGQVLECYHIAGEYDYLLKVLTRDMENLENFITGSLKNCTGVSRTSTIIVLSTIKEDINVANYTR